MTLREFAQLAIRTTHCQSSRQENKHTAMVQKLPRPPKHIMCPNRIDCVAKKTTFKDFEYHQAQVGGNLTKKEYDNLTSRKCHYCCIQKCNGIDRITNIYGYEKFNVVPCCALCNYVKGPFDQDIYLHHLRVVAYTQPYFKYDNYLQIHG